MIYPSACLVVPEHFAAIISEGIYQVEMGTARAHLENWLKEHGRGWYLRDSGSPFDCHLISDEVFMQLYFFNSSEDVSLFKRVTSRS